MIAVDTNVLVRLVTNDDATQGAAAARVFASNDVFVSKTVILETAWVLDYSYGLDRATLHAALSRLLTISSVTVEASAAVATALAWFADGFDLADALHLVSSGRADRFATFDRAFARRARKAKTTPAVDVV